jgi:GH25 family lysozyme M1 (1,4-beta-N-acetylmuramidase)
MASAVAGRAVWLAAPHRRGEFRVRLTASIAVRCLVTALCCLGALGSSAALASASSGAPSPVPRATTYVEGIDVSHYQGTIDWAKVAGSGKQFAFAKATEGQTYSDPTYTTNRSGAEAQGLYFGAYHFARPDTGTNDAKLEADHFASVAGYRKGEIAPTLDLEVSGGLSVDQLQVWVGTFLQELKVKTGVRAMIYTSPSFWQTYMGDTSYYADHGYKLLWIANWDVSQPTVPGSDWGGYGWTFWQWTDCETVPGITGCVDGDRYNKPVVAGITG